MFAFKVNKLIKRTCIMQKFYKTYEKQNIKKNTHLCENNYSIW